MARFVFHGRKELGDVLLLSVVMDLFDGNKFIVFSTSGINNLVVLYHIN